MKSVKDFGAVGDGHTDDTAALSRAVKECRHLYLPAGVYVVTAPIFLPPDTRIMGAGRDLTYVIDHGASHSFFIGTDNDGRA